jgi:hypothetical protein
VQQRNGDFTPEWSTRSRRQQRPTGANVFVELPNLGGQLGAALQRELVEETASHGVTSPMYPVDNATSSYQTVLSFAA